jgi:hypothetical protein
LEIALATAIAVRVVSVFGSARASLLLSVTHNAVRYNARDAL